MRFLFIILFILTSSLSFAHEMVVKDTFNRLVRTPAKVEKILALGPGALRFVVYAGAQDMVVGREMFEEKLSKPLRPYTYALSPKFSKLPVVSAGGPGKMPDIEKVLMSKADVIFAVGFTNEQLDDIQKKTNIPTISLNYGDVGHADMETVKESVRIVGYVTHNQQKAQSVINKMAMLRKDLMSRTEGLESKSVMMASVAFKGTRDFNSSEKQHPACTILGVTNLADMIETKSGTHVTIQMEKILSEQPDFIFYDITGLDVLKQTYSEKLKYIRLLKAENRGQIHSILPYNWYNTNIENLFLTAFYMGKVMYPERFKDVSIAHYADEIYNVFLHVNPYEKIAEKFPAYRRMNFEESGVTFSGEN